MAEREVTIKQFLLGMTPYVLVRYDPDTTLADLDAGGGDPQQYEAMLKTALFQVRQERRRRAAEARRARRRARGGA